MKFLLYLLKCVFLFPVCSYQWDYFRSSPPKGDFIDIESIGRDHTCTSSSGDNDEIDDWTDPPVEEDNNESSESDGDSENRTTDNQNDVNESENNDNDSSEESNSEESNNNEDNDSDNESDSGDSKN